MAQTSTLQEPKVAVLNWQVVETDVLGNRWVIAAFDLEDDARAFVGIKSHRLPDATYEVREDPKWLATVEQARALRRSPDVHPAHEEIEP